MDAGPSLNPAVDIGQVEGAYVMGLGHILLEGTKHHKDTGALLTTNTWTYKPPNFHDIPEEFVVEMVDLKSKDNCWGCMFGCVSCCVGCMGNTADKPSKINPKMKSSKALGEPPLLLSYTIMCALRHAIRAVRGKEFVVNLVQPVTPEQVSALCWGEYTNFMDLKGDQKNEVEEETKRAGLAQKL